MDNLAIARILREIADLLEIKNDNPFKIRAYRNGADIAANHPHHLPSLDEAGLREIPGIGKDLAGKIREIADTGSAAFHRELLAEFPPQCFYRFAWDSSSFDEGDHGLFVDLTFADGGVGGIGRR